MRTGVAPVSTIAEIEARKVCATVITSSPGPIPAAITDRCSAWKPLLTPTAYFVPTYSARFFSKDFSCDRRMRSPFSSVPRSEEHTSELQSLAYLVCRLLLEKKKKRHNDHLH